MPSGTIKRPFQSLCQFWIENPCDTSEEILDIAQALLESGQNAEPNLILSNFPGSLARRKPLHVAEANLCALLLRGGADVNSLDTTSLAALDYRSRGSHIEESRKQ